MNQSFLSAAIAFVALGVAFPCGAAAGCSRPIAVPVSANGASVQMAADGIRGIYPDLLRGVADSAGCSFDFALVPRARQVALYGLGQADILIPASHTTERDRHGTFVPLISTRPMLISVEGNHAPVTSAQDLLDRRDLRVAVVRGFDYGEGYMALTAELAKQGRLFVEVDVTSVARLLHAGSADLTIMGPSTMISVARREPRVQGLFARLRTDAIAELPWRYSGAYVSKALPKEDQQQLLDALEKAARTNSVMDGYVHYFGPDLLKGGVRPR
ncbi:MAG: transporter substrate-binding domain-containing protein [Duganella sp.]